MHNWNNDGVDWKGIAEAGDFIRDYCIKWARLGGSVKEKYGTVRFYPISMGSISLHQVVYPGYQRNRFPSWLWNFDIDYATPLLTKLFGSTYARWQEKVYYRAYKKAVYKWPHLRAEILVAADYLDLLNDGDLVRIEGRKTYVLGWNGETLGTMVSCSDPELEC